MDQGMSRWLLGGMLYVHVVRAWDLRSRPPWKLGWASTTCVPEQFLQGLFALGLCYAVQRGAHGASVRICGDSGRQASECASDVAAPDAHARPRAAAPLVSRGRMLVTAACGSVQPSACTQTFSCLPIRALVLCACVCVWT